MTVLMRRTLFVMFLAALTGGCSHGRPLSMHAIPPFSPVAPQEGVQVYQVRWERSWRPTIHVIAWRQANEGGAQAWVAFGAFEAEPGPLNYQEIDLERWDAIEQAAARSGFWEYDSSCDEVAYRARSLYSGAKGACDEIVMSDGASINIAASDGKRARGITSICPNLDLCEPLGELPVAMLAAVGRESWLFRIIKR